jgi:hypothetical protein
VEEQRVVAENNRNAADSIREAEQRVVDDSPIITIPRITDAPGIIDVRNPMAKRRLKETPQVHR